MNDEQPPHALPVALVDAELADLVPRYLNNRWSDLSHGHSLLAAREFDQLAGMGHRIRGSASSYGFDGLGEIATKMQQAALDADAVELKRLLSRFERYLRDVRIRYL
ncbi:MAG: Hpt domain-containing protein [Gammaproteobacteria bacterium]|nr:Hpt domain-containing protein [Gammaproteobacteria bacterium]